jgi:hypothetical protein
VGGRSPVVDVAGVVVFSEVDVSDEAPVGYVSVEDAAVDGDDEAAASGV